MKLLVIGEICLDVFVKCKSDRLSPEAPVPVLCPISQTENYGMAGNVVANLKSLGGPDIVVHTMTPTNTIVKTRYVDYLTGHMFFRIDENDKSDSLIIDMDHKYEQYDGIIISDYCKGLLNTAQIRWFSDMSFDKGIPIFLDTKKQLGDWSELITFVKINDKEFCQLVNPNKCANLIYTRGALGSTWYNEGYTASVDPIQVADVSGAGDTYLAAFAIHYLKMYKDWGRKQATIQAMIFANRAARIAVSKRGVVAVKKEEL